MILKNQIPNFVTLLNLLCGSIAGTLAFSGELVMASWFIIFAAMFDFLDGMLARALNAYSAIGAQLDSLADVVSFGLAPAAILFVLLHESIGIAVYSGELTVLPFVAFIFLISAAYRLARFNAEGSEIKDFIGLPAPAAGLFVASIPLIPVYGRPVQIIWGFISNEFILLGITGLLSFLMISRIPMLSLKFRNLKWQDNRAGYILAGSAAVLLPLLHATAIPFIITIYILLSLAEKYLYKGGISSL
ncbi:MAG: CDP-diacylglycerol--serine O-phosphatidyltransferase [Bacteroidales bacterium]